MPTRMGMTRWYDPGLLLQTGIRATISTVFGRFADRREAIAAANAVAAMPADSEFDYAERFRDRDFWFDYLADTGDGWNPTFAMAQLASRALSPAGDVLPRGELLILGGDQVYPTAAPDDYRNRFRHPFDEAYASAGPERWPDADGKRPDLYAIPGNHDWYDGLNAFFGLFCRRRVASPGELGISRPGAVIAGRQTRQSRSYFAISLPGDWWVWGTDSQLEGYIDQPQIDYFQHAASYWMRPRSRLILCVAEPSWVHVDPANPEKRFGSFSYLERLAGMAKHPVSREPMGHRLELVLTGDSHHYAHYVERDEPGEGPPSRHYIVCGGGGAFLHPTHQLNREISFTTRFPRPGAAGSEGRYPRLFRLAQREGGEEALFPERVTSRRLAWRNLGFAALNWRFALVLGVAYLVFNWILNFAAGTTQAGNLAAALAAGTFGEALVDYFRLVFVSPWAPILMGVALAGYYYFAHAPNGKVRLVMALGHSATQALVVTLVTIAVVRLTGRWWDGGLQSAAILVAAGLAAGALSATAFGLYLLLCLNLFGRHANEAFSSLRIQGYKSFLRLRISEGRLTIFAIGLESVPDHRGGSSDDPAARARLVDDPIHFPPDRTGTEPA